MDTISYILGKKASGGGGSTKYAPRKISFTGYQGTELNYEVNNLDLSNMEAINSMFSSCSNLQKLDLTSWDLSNFTNINHLFYDCASLKELKLNGCVIDNITSMISTFAYVGYNNDDNTTLSIDLSGFNNVNIGYGSQSSTFEYCKITHINFGNNFILFTSGMFSNALKFDDYTLNQILNCCIKTKQVKGYAYSLRFLGLDATAYPDARIQALENYEAFVNAGCSIN